MLEQDSNFLGKRHLLRTEGLRKRYHARVVVKDVSLEVKSGEIVGLLGPNGAGKTTTFRILIGMHRPDEGEVYLDGEKLSHLPMHMRARRGLVYLPQEPSVFRHLTVEENLMAILETLPLSRSERWERLRKLLEEFRLGGLAKQKAWTLSGGERRRVEISRALIRSPVFILLDEPFTGIDPIAVSDIQKIMFHLKEKGYGILITDHNVRETLRITDRGYIMDSGTLRFSGTPGELAADPEARRLYLGENFEL